MALWIGPVTGTRPNLRKKECLWSMRRGTAPSSPEFGSRIGESLVRVVGAVPCRAPGLRPGVVTRIYFWRQAAAKSASSETETSVVGAHSSELPAIPGAHLPPLDGAFGGADISPLGPGHPTYQRLRGQMPTLPSHTRPCTWLPSSPLWPSKTCRLFP